MDFPLYFQQVIWQWRNLIFTEFFSEKAKPLEYIVVLGLGVSKT